MSAALVFKNLTLGYDRLPAVQQLDTEIQEGSLTAIVGPNGAGKSTLLKGVTGALSPLEGQVHIDGFRDEEIAYLPQQSEIDRSFPICVVDLVAMGLWHKIGAFGRLRPAMPARLDAAIAAVGLTGFEKRSIGSLSGGQMQRALFARLLLQDARLVLLDEPFAGIDPIAIDDIKNVLKDLKNKGIAILITDHNVREALDICDNAIVINNGQVIAKGAKEELTKNELVKKVYLGNMYS